MNWLRRQWQALRKKWRAKQRRAWAPPPMPAPASRGFILWRPFRRLGRSRAQPAAIAPAPQAFILWRPFIHLWFSLRQLFNRESFANPLSYWRNRDWRRLLFGVPALLALAGVIFVGVSLGSQNKRKLADWYLERAQEGRRSNDKEASLACTEAIVRMYPDDSIYLMRLAEMSIETGETVRGKAILESLAPVDQNGYPSAHLRLAQLLLEQTPSTPQNVPLATKHLLRIADAESEIGIAASGLLGKIYAATNRPDRAVTFLRRVTRQPYFRVLLAQQYLRLGDLRSAEWEANGCVEGLESKLEGDPSDIKTRLLLVASRNVLKQHNLAVRLLDQGIELAPRAEATAELRFMRSDTYRKWLQTLENDPQSSLAVRFAVLEMALVATPDDPELLVKLLAFTDPKSKEGKLAREFLYEQVTDGQSIRHRGLAHYVLGCLAWQEKDFAVAKSHFEQGHRELGNDASISNNLAWALMKTEPPDFNRALEMANAALQQVPNHPEFRHTRGTILIKMERWSDAITDLEFALAGGNHPEQAGTHALLAKAYGALGNLKMAELHRAKAGPDLKATPQKKANTKVDMSEEAVPKQ